MGQKLGVPGILGVGLLIFCALFHYSSVRALEEEVRARDAAAERLRTRTPAQLATTNNRGEDLRRFYDLFPSVETLPQELERVHVIARAASLDIRQAEYRLEAPGSDLVAYRVTLPVRGTYAEVRQFIGAMLKEMPIVSIDALRFERKEVRDRDLEAQLRMTMHFRPRVDEAYRAQADTQEAR